MNQAKQIVLLFINLLLFTAVFSQQKNVKKAKLTIGDKLPDIVIQNVLDYPATELKLSDFKDKFVILDFWATWCVPCVSMMPRMDSLQQQFKERLQFLPVTYQRKEEVIPFLEKYKKITNHKVSLPKVMGDTVLRYLFPHLTVPHYVWIGPDGIVKAITGMDEISTGTIAAMLEKGRAPLTLKEEPDFMPFDSKKPFLVNGNGGDGAGLIYQSALSRFIPGLEGGFSINIDKNTGIGKLSLINVPLYWFYRSAFGTDSLWIGRNRLELNLAEPCKFNFNDSCGKYDDWKQINGYAYQLFSPAKDRNDLFGKLREDLERLFPMYKATIEKRNRTCWVLSRTGSAQPLTANPDRASRSGMGIVRGVGYTIQNSYIRGFIQNMNVFPLQNSPYPLIDETGITERVDLEIDAKLSDMEAVSRSLEKYGLKITLEERDINLLVIRDVPVK